MGDIKKRDVSIDVLKFFAVFLIINSHMDICYPKYSVLATGGAIGDCLFLFASGYTLFWKQPIGFLGWYKDVSIEYIPQSSCVPLWVRW